MPSVSKAQQRFMGLVHAYKKGEVPASQVSQAVKDAAKSMKKKSTKKFASTKHKGLPNKVRSENMNEDGHTDVASAERKLKLIMKDAMDTLNALRNLSNEDSLPSWWTDKITLAKDYVGKSRDYIMNPAESVNEAERKMSSLEMLQIILLAKAMREMPGSPAQKKIKKQINVIRKKLGQAPVKESVNEAVEPRGNIKKVLDVAKNKQAKKIGGTLVDGTTANMMTQVWNKVNDSSKEKMNKMNTKQLINLILRLWKAMGTPRV